MIKISKLSDYATLLMMALASEPHQAQSTQYLAGVTRLKLPTIRKVLKMLLQQGLVLSKQGSLGGYCLAKQPAEITIAQILKATEGAPALTECTQASSQCQVEANCSLRSNWRLINHAIYIALDQITLVDMQQPLHQHSSLQTGVPLIFHSLELNKKMKSETNKACTNE